MTTDKDIFQKIEIACIHINIESFYKIINADEMRPFFMRIVSDLNHWLFISSNGGISAGKKILTLHYPPIKSMIKQLNQQNKQVAKQSFKFIKTAEGT